MTPAPEVPGPERPAARTSFKAVERNPAYLQVAEQLRAAIVEGRLSPGDELPTERALCAEFGVSRTTVREALRALQAQGYVRSGGAAPMRSVVSANPGLLGRAYDELLARDQVTILDLIPFRGMLEIAAIERAALEPDADRLAELREAAAVVGRVEADDVDGLFAAYLEFHVALVRSSGNQALLLTMEAVQGAMRDHLYAAVRDVTSGAHRTWTAQRLSEVYTRVVEALEGGDADAAGAVLLSHMSDFYIELLSAPAPQTADGG
jgi:GntR family transcriptional repressor for pyruvate dehydrogenase complex